MWMPDDRCEEKELFDRLWRDADKNRRIQRYENPPQRYFAYLAEWEFHVGAVLIISGTKP